MSTQPKDPVSLLQGLIGLLFGAGLVWQSFQEKISMSMRGLAPGNEFPNPFFFKVVLRVCGFVILVVSLWKLSMVAR